MKSEPNRVNARVEHSRVNLREHAIEEVITHTLLLVIVEASASRQIFEGGTKNPDLHSKLLRNSFFASSQSKISMCPAANSASVLCRASSCHAGLANDSWSAAR